MKQWTAIIVLLAAAGIWGWRLIPAGAPTEKSLRQTGGLSVQVISTRATPRGVEAACRINNAAPRAADQVVLRLELKNSQGQVIAANPLAAVANVAAGHSRDAVFLLPSRAAPPGHHVDAEVSLVRWRD